MSDSSLSFIERNRKNIDLIDEEWIHDALSDDGKCFGRIKRLDDTEFFLIPDIPHLGTQEIQFEEEEDEEQDVRENDHTWNELGMDNFPVENNQIGGSQNYNTVISVNAPRH
jgi:hypothetical protein